MSTALAIGGWFAQGFIQTLLDKASDSAVQRLAGLRGLDGDLRRLRASLFKIHALLDMAERRRCNSSNLVELMKQLKDASFDAENLLDEFEYQNLKHKIEGQASDFFTLAFNAAKNFFSADGDGFGSRLRAIQEKLCEIAADMIDIMQLLSMDDAGRQSTGKLVRRETSSFLTEEIVFGRDNEREKVIALLLGSAEGSESSNHVFSVLPLVGIGGVGKTTLAQLVYNDDRVGNYFQLKIWICVSDDFDVKRLTKELIESTTKEEQSGLTNLDTLQSRLKEKIELKRFLLVLDDVWSENKDEWDKLCAPLSFGAHGSKIIVTTRHTKVASIVGTVSTIFLHGLEDDALWELFKKHAFASQIVVEEHPELVIIGREIASKLKGSPLAAKTLGSLLRSDLNEQHWRTIMESEVWQLPQQENEILPVLQLSYHYLSGHLKQCFAFCSVFRKDYIFCEHTLVSIWMAEGFIAPQENMRMEDVGSSCFHELVSRSFFQETQRRGRFVMHDLIHDLAQFVSVGECHRVDGDKFEEIPKTICHLSATLTAQRKLMEFSGYHKLRTLMINYQNNQNQFVLRIETPLVPDDLFRRLKDIRVLSLPKCGMKELTETIGEIIHLRYLDISYNSGIVKLPESLCVLYNLQVLRLCGCQLQGFPQGMSNLINLRQLHAADEIISKVKEVGKLISLQELPIFKVLKYDDGHKLAQLCDLKQLHGELTISNLENVNSEEEASLAKLKNKKYLDALKLEWKAGQESNLEKEHVSEEVLEGLQPHHSLRSLTIRRYNGGVLPSWLQASPVLKLETLKLESCKRCRDLSCTGELPLLKVLHIKGMPQVKQISPSLCCHTKSKFFQQLHELVLEDMLALEELPDLGQLPYLKSIQMKGMNALRCIGNGFHGANGSNWFPRLEKLRLQNMQAMEELPFLGHLPCLKVIDIRQMPALKHIYHAHYDSIERNWFSTLEVMVLENMLSLEELPCLGQLPCVKYLRLDIKKIAHGFFRVPSENNWLPKLEKLELKGIPGYEELPSLEQLPHLTVLHLDGMTSVKAIRQGCTFTAEQIKCFSRLEELVFRDMPTWEEWSWAEGGEHFACLCRLKIAQCPKLKQLPPLPACLLELELIHVGLTELPGLWKGTNGNSRSKISSLTRLHISECPSLRNLEEGLLSNHLPHINSILILDCVELMFLPVKKFSELTSLEMFSVRHCPKLMMTQSQDIDVQLPTSIKILGLCNCASFGKSLPGCLYSLSLLTRLSISNCPHMETLPGEAMLHLKQLWDVSIKSCDELRSIGGITFLSTLTRLELADCPKLLLNGMVEEGKCLSLLELRVDNTALLKVSPILNSLPSIHFLYIFSSYQAVMFDGEDQGLLQSLTAIKCLEFGFCKNLKSLPTELHSLPSLKSLALFECPEIQSLPEKGLPPFLTDLRFQGCHSLLTKKLEEHLQEIKNSGRFDSVFA
ncbi:disease resistance protein RGA2-like [Zingiber officinale]|uniref:Uncharacterized protein n=1 Tax=Zingiber officinale TaxID=94328 RepID=A0A8J5I2I6_ZINOF|nr:disease resistance protein RGA2-like [Zingiber officinale]KAG6532476.1 hypothetical protein ZIOFF_006322 [Zingiber officinale]